jgi:anti-anti-sigma factor
VRGEVDVATAPRILSAVGGVLRQGVPREVAVDLRQVSFFGSAGISELLTAAAECALAGARLVVVADNRVVLRPLHVTGQDDVLTVRRHLGGCPPAEGAVPWRHR